MAPSLDVSMADLSQEISSQVAELTKLLQSGTHPQPSLRADAPSEYPVNGSVYAARHAIIDACSTLIQLAQGPRDFVWQQTLTLKVDSFVLGALGHFGIFAAVPSPPASISYAELAAKIGLSRDITERILRHAMTSSIFCEPTPGMVSHTANSMVVRESAQLEAWVGLHREDFEPTMLKLEGALEKWGESGKTEETAVNLALGKDQEDTFWSILADDDSKGREKGWRMRRFGIAMGGSRNPAPDPTSFPNVLFDWDSLGEALVVDVGGGAGLLSREIATFHPKLMFIVQDQPNQQVAFEACIPSHLRTRISFAAHDFFTSQPAKDADVFFMSSILHDWPDEMAANILRQLAAVMKSTSRIMLLEQVVQDGGDVSNATTKYTRSLDLLMLSCFNGRERSRENWEDLVKAADKRLVVKDIVFAWVGAPRALIEIGFKK